MVGRQENFYGNILFYDYLSKRRAPVALNRNLTRAWRVHRQLSENTSTIGLVGEHHDLRPFWQPPARDALDDMVEHEKSRGVFVLEIHGIARTPTAKAKRMPERVEPTRKARALLHVKSSVQVAIFSPLSNLPCLSHPPQNATLRSTSKQVDGAVSVETQRISINPRDFSHHVPLAGTNDAYKLSIIINLESANDAEDLYGHFALERSAPQKASTRLSTTWPNVLHCPSRKAVLKLKDWKDFLPLGLEVTMHWTPVTGESILTRHNQNLRVSALLPAAYATPPPLASAGLPTYKILYVYTQKTIERDDLGCPHDGCERRRGHTDIESLRMHLDSWHDHLKYKATKQASEVDGKEVWVFECDVSDHRAHRAEQRASDRTDDPFDVRIIPPPEPFNQRQYLDEDNDDYRRTSRVNKRYAAPKVAATVQTSSRIPLRRKPPDQVQDKPIREKKRYPVPEGPAGVTFFRACSRRPLITGEYISESDDEVDDSWIKLRKSAEFDREEQIPASAKKLLKAIDSHMWSEQLQSEIHVGDAMVRFAREHRHWIWQEGLFEALTDKMHELLQDDIVSKEVHDGCLEIVENAKPDVAEEGSELSQRLSQIQVSHDELYEDPPRLQKSRSPELSMSATLESNRRRGGSRQRKFDKGKGKARVTETGHLTPIMTPIISDSDGDLEMREATLITEEDFAADQEASSAPLLPYDLCLCGKDAQSSTCKSQMIACASMVSMKLPHVHGRCCIVTMTELYTKKLSFRLHQRALESHSKHPRSQKVCLDL
jgi:hypothetical protein